MRHRNRRQKLSTNSGCPLIVAAMNCRVRLPVVVVVLTVAAVVVVMMSVTANAVVVMVTLPWLELCSLLSL